MPVAEGIARLLGFVRPSFGTVEAVDYTERWGLVEYFGLNDDGGNVNLVGSHAGVTLTNNNGVTLATGEKVGDGAAQFASASSQSLSVADNAELSTGDMDIWLAAWIWADALTGGTFPNIAGKNTGTAATMEYFLQINATALTIAFATGGAAQRSVSSATTIATGQWIFVMGYHDSVNDVNGISINGEAFTTATTSGTEPSDTTTAFRIGARSLGASGDRFFDGRIDAVAVGKSPALGIAALATEIRDRLYNGGSGREYPFLS